MGIFGGTPEYKAPPAPPPMAAPPTLANASAESSAAAQQRNNIGAAMSTVATSPDGVSSGSVQRANTTLGGTK